jgi:CheY-like chemotaxis protein
MNILIIEDSMSIQKIFSKILAEYLSGKHPLVSIRCCASKKEFNDLITAGFIPDFVLSDWMLLHENAYSLIDELISLHEVDQKNIAIITGFISDFEVCAPHDKICHSLKDLIKRYSGISLYEKPINVQQLIEIFTSLGNQKS